MLPIANEPILIAVGAFFLAVFINKMCNVYRKQISSIPGPWYSNWTDLILEYHWIIGNRPNYVHSLHQKYGRSGPNEIDICDVNAVRDMSKSGTKFLKSAWYDKLAVGGAKNIFSVRDPKAHSIRRRLLSSPMADASLQSMEPVIKAKVKLAIHRMRTEMKDRGAMDIFKWWYFTSTDVIGELTFGESFQLLEQGEKTQFAMDLERLPKLGMIGTAFPSLLRLARQLPVPYFQDALQAGKRISEYAEQSLMSYKESITQEPSHTKPTLFTKLLHASNTTDGLSDVNLISEARGYIVGGSDNTAVTLTYLVWAVCRNEEIKKTLLRELETLPDDFGDDELKKLPFLNHVVNETLRLYASNPSNRPRNAPSPGANLCGYWVPSEVTVSTQAYSLHRDSKIFSHPESFNSLRWASPTTEMNRAFVPFGGGSRICLGLHLAIRELRLGAAHFFRAFPRARMSTAEKMSDGDMDQVCYFIMSPKGKRCLMESM
ncbi:hypothetical protein MW887_004632 [Aspergillus wentii]|nr:hypothetical protein MW887_004632 [Aspergillus wentii]